MSRVFTKRVREMRTLLRASLSSIVATGVDGVTYQAVLVLAFGSYWMAAIVGALLGGLTNFTLNRTWAFTATAKDIRLQAFEYAIACLATYLALQTCLYVLIEGLAISAPIAWVPAKIAAWLAFPIRCNAFLSSPRRVACQSTTIGFPSTLRFLFERLP